jgi:putative transposase
MGGPVLSAADEQLLRELTERARAGGLKLTGEGGLLGKLTKMVIEGALENEMDDHLGYSKHDPAGRDGGNSRNGHRPKTVLTEAGPVGFPCRGTGIPASSRRSWRKGSGGSPGSRTW